MVGFCHEQFEWRFIEVYVARRAQRRLELTSKIGRDINVKAPTAHESVGLRSLTPSYLLACSPILFPPILFLTDEGLIRDRLAVPAKGSALQVAPSVPSPGNLRWQPHRQHLQPAGRTADVSAARGARGKCLQLEWDASGRRFAILQSGSPIVKLWDSNQSLESSLDTMMKDLTYLRWSSTKPLLAIGTAKGNLLLYDKRTLKKQSIMGKHSRRINAGAWNSTNELALASDDKQVTISNEMGETIIQHSLRAEPSHLRYHNHEDDHRDMRESLLSAVLGNKSIMVFDVSDPDTIRNALELTFASSHGPIVSYEWSSPGCLTVGFESGFIGRVL